MQGQVPRVRNIFRFFKMKMTRSPKKIDLIGSLASMEDHNSNPSSLVLLMKLLIFSKILMQNYRVRLLTLLIPLNLQRGARRVDVLINPVVETARLKTRTLSSLK